MHHDVFVSILEEVNLNEYEYAQFGWKQDERIHSWYPKEYAIGKRSGWSKPINNNVWCVRKFDSIVTGSKSGIIKI